MNMVYVKYALLLIISFVSDVSFAQIGIDSAPAVASLENGALGEYARRFVASGEYQAIITIVTYVGWIAGAIYGIKTLGQLKDHSDNPNQTKLMKPLTSMVVTGLLMQQGALLDMLSTTLWGATQTNGIGTLISDPMAVDCKGQSDLACGAQHFAHSIPALEYMILIVSVGMGLFIAFRGVFMLPQLEQGRVEPAKVVWTFIAASILLSLPQVVNITMSTVYDTGVSGNVLTAKFNSAGGGDLKSFYATIHAVLMFIQLLGLIAFVRGVLILKAIGENKDGAMGRALTHIFGGAAAMNIYWTTGVLANTFGMQETICMKMLLC